ncbi:hypothetical protein R69746_07738 [Paraburkholderia aspalathi]|nr:hypothetical protein R69746_07738 [Paraburkholderia aspalathi]
MSFSPCCQVDTVNPGRLYRLRPGLLGGLRRRLADQVGVGVVPAHETAHDLRRLPDLLGHGMHKLFAALDEPMNHRRAVKVPALGKAVQSFGEIKRRFLRPLPCNATGQLVEAAEIIRASVQGRGLTVPGHADICKVPIHAAGRQYIGPVNRDAL